MTTHPMPLDARIAQIQQYHRMRQDWVRTNTKLTNQCVAICRRIAAGRHPEWDDLPEAKRLERIKDAGRKMADAVAKGDPDVDVLAVQWCLPILNARGGIEQQRDWVETELEKLAKGLPVVPWLKEVKGFSYGSLAAVIGECGDLSKYANPGKVWKRMGLALVQGERQRKVTDPELAILHGYSPSRRSIMWNVGACLIKAQVRTPKDDKGKPTGEPSAAIGPLGALYLERKRYELERNPEIKLAHAHNRAQRYIEKRLLRELWQAWRQAITSQEPSGSVPAS